MNDKGGRVIVFPQRRDRAVCSPVKHIGAIDGPSNTFRPLRHTSTQLAADRSPETSHFAHKENGEFERAALVIDLAVIPVEKLPEVRVLFDRLLG